MSLPGLRRAFQIMLWKKGELAGGVIVNGYLRSLEVLVEIEYRWW
jgi:hypothetical protein